MKKLRLLTELTNRKIKYAIKILLITSSVITTIINTPNLSFAHPGRDITGGSTPLPTPPGTTVPNLDQTIRPDPSQEHLKSNPTFFPSTLQPSQPSTSTAYPEETDPYNNRRQDNENPEDNDTGLPQSPPTRSFSVFNIPFFQRIKNTLSNRNREQEDQVGRSNTASEEDTTEEDTTEEDTNDESNNQSTSYFEMEDQVEGTFDNLPNYEPNNQNITSYLETEDQDRAPTAPPPPPIPPITPPPSNVTTPAAEGGGALPPPDDGDKIIPDNITATNAEQYNNDYGKIFDLINKSNTDVININDDIVSSNNSVNKEPSGVASGDEDSPLRKKNLWISGAYSKSHYEKNNDTANWYIGKTTATAVGGNIEFNNNTLMGIAYNYVQSTFNYKNVNDKRTSKTHIISLYGQSNLTKKLTLKGLVSLGFGDINTQISSKNQIIKNKIKNKPYSSKIILAHKSNIGNLVIIPNIAFKYSIYSLGNYTQNSETESLYVANSTYKKSSEIIGIRTILPMQIANSSLIITPELHVEAEKFFHNKNKAMDVITVSNNSNSSRQLLYPGKPTKYSYKIGGNVTIKYGITELTTAYDYLATDKKHINHKGSLKLKIFF